MPETISSYINRRRNEIPKYGLLLFDHSLGEYLSLTTPIKPEEQEKFEAIRAKRNDGTIGWKDIYNFRLMLIGHYDLETLKSKIIGLRVKYQSLVDIAEFNNYMTERAVVLNDSAKPIAQDNEQDMEKLRNDYIYLLDEFFLRYSYVSAHEELRTKLLWRGAFSTFCFFFVAAVFNILAFTTFNENYNKVFEIFSITLSVVFAGVMGAFVSMQERLQNFSHKGDPVYNLSLLTHGWLSIFLSPISGAIFAAILYFFFTAGLLKGEIFPEMVTLASVGDPPSAIELKRFVLNTGPKDGKAFALLIIWSFIAGFAERFVPDTLMRLVNQKKPGETTT